jgi:uncharacterized protein YbjT (DUF2867 family)
VSVVLVTGGTGTLGTHAVRLLGARGHNVRVLSRRTGGDLRTGVGVREAAAGVELVLHAASDPHYRRGAGDPQQTRNLFAACAHVRHLLYVSIVGVHQIPLRYYAHKLECERLVNEGGLSHALAEGRNTTPAHADGRLTWAQYFARR